MGHLSNMRKLIKKFFVLILLIFLLTYVREIMIYPAIESKNMFLVNAMSIANPLIDFRPIPGSIIGEIFSYYFHTPLIFAIRRGSYEAVEILLKNGANPNATDNYGKYNKLPLEYCLTYGGKDIYKIAELLIKNGAKYRNEASYLIYLLGKDDPGTNDYKYKLFIDWFKTNDLKIFDSNHEYYNYYFLIRSAIFGNSYKELKYIFEHYSIDANYLYEHDDIPYTVLAIANHRPEILKLLIEYGADINIIFRGKTLEEMIKSDELVSKKEYDRERKEYIVVDYAQINNEMLNIIKLAQSGKIKLSDN